MEHQRILAVPALINIDPLLPILLLNSMQVLQPLIFGRGSFGSLSPTTAAIRHLNIRILGTSVFIEGQHQSAVVLSLEIVYLLL